MRTLKDENFCFKSLKAQLVKEMTDKLSAGSGKLDSLDMITVNAFKDALGFLSHIDPVLFIQTFRLVCMDYAIKRNVDMEQNFTFNKLAWEKLIPLLKTGKKRMPVYIECYDEISTLPVLICKYLLDNSYIEIYSCDESLKLSFLNDFSKIIGVNFDDVMRLNGGRILIHETFKRVVERIKDFLSPEQVELFSHYLSKKRVGLDDYKYSAHERAVIDAAIENLKGYSCHIVKIITAPADDFFNYAYFQS